MTIVAIAPMLNEDGTMITVNAYSKIAMKTAMSAGLCLTNALIFMDNGIAEGVLLFMIFPPRNSVLVFNADTKGFPLTFDRYDGQQQTQEDNSVGQ